ncbi:hypothetical protein GQ42DRAFT_74691 [Ramicandelaber brevisporus]|nr:hypothetical protein GQ42DRAFT_74691 [Ramicandelaber brevisporus]
MKASIITLVLVSASATYAQLVGGIFCHARYVTNVATCVIGVKECLTVEKFSNCVCTNTGNKERIRMCMTTLLKDDSFKGTLMAGDLQAIRG